MHASSISTLPMRARAREGSGEHARCLISPDDLQLSQRAHYLAEVHWYEIHFNLPLLRYLCE